MSTWGPNLWHEGLWETFFIQALAPSCGLLNVYRVPQIPKIDNKIWGALDSGSDALLQVTPTFHKHTACFPGCWAVNKVQGHFPRHCCVSSSHLKKMIITVFFFFFSKMKKPSLSRILKNSQKCSLRMFSVCLGSVHRHQGLREKLWKLSKL